MPCTLSPSMTTLAPLADTGTLMSRVQRACAALEKASSSAAGMSFAEVFRVIAAASIRNRGNGDMVPFEVAARHDDGQRLHRRAHEEGGADAPVVGRQRADHAEDLVAEQRHEDDADAVDRLQ